jgi:hypothetical protein
MPMTLSGIETVTFRLVTQCVNQLRQRSCNKCGEENTMQLN